MLTRLHVRGFKSLRDLAIELPALTVLFGPNSAGKSNILEAAQFLARIGTARTLSEAFSGPVRGQPVEFFPLPKGGLAELLRQAKAEFVLECTTLIGRERYKYRVGVGLEPASGDLVVTDEYLAKLTRAGTEHGAPVLERVGDIIRIRRKSKPAHPRQEPVGLNHTLLSDRRFAGPEYRIIERFRDELDGWRIYYLDPRVAMRSPRSPAQVQDIGVLGDDIAPFLHRLKAERPTHYQAVRRTLRSLVPSVEDLDVDLDEKRGTLDIRVRQGGIEFSSRVMSEGTLRVLALCAIAANPWAGGMIAFEEPENGVHPRRLELIAQLLASLALERGRQVIVTTHSALFCSEVLKVTGGRPEDVAVMAVRHGEGGTQASPLRYPNGLFCHSELAEGLTSPDEDGAFEGL